MGGDALAGNTLVPRQHPDDYVRNTVLRLGDMYGEREGMKSVGNTVEYILSDPCFRDIGTQLNRGVGARYVLRLIRHVYSIRPPTSTV